jgi:oligopeptide transport system substrate-binding protein
MLLSACGGNNNKTSSENAPTDYTYVYPVDPTTFDYLQTNLQTNNMFFTNFEDGLMENDPDGNLVGDLATSWSVSSDQLTYTFHIRKNVKWVAADGSEYANVKPSDWVTGLQHAADSKSDMLYLVEPVIKGLDAYASGKTKDFSTVGIKADDSAMTLQYTLNQPTPYFISLTAYSILDPVNSDFLTSKGKDFGNVSSPSNLLYNGPYVLANFTSKSVLEMTANESYWDKKNVHIQDIKLNYFDGAQPSLLYSQFDKGVYTEGRLYPNDPSWKQAEAKYKDNVFFRPTDDTCFNMTFNLDRQKYKLTSKKTDAQKNDTKKAILNRDFRAAISLAINRETMNAQNVGKDAALVSLTNTLVPPDFVNIAGKPYGDTVKSDLDSLDSSVWKNIDINKGNNSAYNQTEAKAEFAKAKTALQAEGVSFPIHLDLPQDSTSTVLTNEVKSLKQSVEATLGTDNVVVDLQLVSSDDMNNATYLVQSGDQSDFDISTASGWSPDYADPQSYLHIYDTRDGDLLQTIGLIATSDQAPSASMANAIKATGLDQYDQMLDEAAKFTSIDQEDQRYTAYAKAEAYLLNQFIQVPLNSSGGTPFLSNVVPFTGGWGNTGIMNYNNGIDFRYKYVKLQDKPVTTAQYDAAQKAFEARLAKATTKGEVKE